MLFVSKGEHLLQMHLLAYEYHWGYNELLDMPRSDRGLFYDMVQEQLKAENDSIRESTHNTSSSSKTYMESD